MPEKHHAITLKDDLGATLTLAGPPSRIVSLIPSVTETLFELGAGSMVAGVTDYCIHPADAVSEIPKVGGTKGFSIERIRDLDPDLVIANKEENRKPEIDALRRGCPVFVTYPRSVEQAMKTILDLGTLTGRTTEASTMAAGCGSLLESIYPPVLGRSFRTITFVWRDPWMGVGRGTYVDDLLDTFGFDNIFAVGDGRYPRTSLQSVFDRGPEIVILPDEPYGFGQADQTEIETFFAGRGSPVRVLRVDGTLVTWFGYRTTLGLEFLRQTKTRLLASQAAKE